MLNFSKKTLVTITAPTAAGKNYLQDMLETHFAWKHIISTTTRKPRVNEREGKDYYFISRAQSDELEKNNLFAELVTFNEHKYGITKQEMLYTISVSEVPAILILEPTGLQQYKKLCQDLNLEMFSIYISLTEKDRIHRLTQRTVESLFDYKTFSKELLHQEIEDHTSRIISATSIERNWINTNIWDVVVPGDDIIKALEMIKCGVSFRNRKNEVPTAFNHTTIEYQHV
jgi:guanylate kinase